MLVAAPKLSDWRGGLHASPQFRGLKRMPWAIAGLVAAQVIVPLAAQNAAQAPQESAPVFRSETSLALVPFHVMLKNRFVISLTAQDVILLEDGKPQPIALFEGGRQAPRVTPIDVLLLFDTGFMNVVTGQMDPVIYKTGLLDELPHVRLGVYGFDAVLRRFCRPTRDATMLANAIQSLVKCAREPEAVSGGKAPFDLIPLELPWQFQGAKIGGDSFIYQALTAALMDADSGPGDATRIIVVFSHGGSPQRPGSEVREAIALANRLGIAIDPVLGNGLVAYMVRLRAWAEAYKRQVELLWVTNYNVTKPLIRSPNHALMHFSVWETRPAGSRLISR